MEFKSGDIVYHKGLNKKGKFLAYDFFDEDTCYVEFKDEYGESETRRVSLYLLWNLER